MQAVTELVEQGRHLRKTQEGRLAGCGLGEVADVVDDGLGPQQLGLVDEIAHPGPAGLVVALEEIEIDQADGRAILVEHLIDGDVRVIDRKVGAGLQDDAVEPLGDVEQAVLEHPVQLQVGLQLLLAQVVLLLAQALGVALPIPGLQLEILALRGDQRLQFGCLRLHRPSRRPG